MKRTILFLFALSALLVLASCGTAATPEPSPPSTASQTAPEENLFAGYSGLDLTGKAADEAIVSGSRLTMVNIWATYCGPCIQEMPALGELAQEYANQGVQILGIPLDIFDEDGIPSNALIDQALSIAQETGATYRHLVANDALLSGKLSQIYAVPTTFFVDAQGNQVGEDYVGSRDKAGWTAVLDHLLQEVAP